MARPLAPRIRRIDQTLRGLSEYRRRCDDPGEVLRVTESIDQWLDERLVLMRRVERQGLVPAEAS